MIYASFKGEGPVEKPDVIGAIFGQTEGLLGSELEMRELQKEGKIGRIEVDLNIVDGKAVGEIRVPSALDKSETTIIAATLETIDRVGPTEAKIEVVKIEDVRGNKRDYIVDRAKRLLEQLDNGSDSGIAKSVREEARVARIQEYGEEKLPAGDLSGNEVIVVEGRADVVNLLRNRVSNVIGMNGTKLPKEIARLGEEKELTLFVDGDRGGKLIARNVIDHARIAYVAVAPDGKEVEELEGKEILMALRKKLPASEYLSRARRSGDEEPAHPSAPMSAASGAVPSAEDVKRTMKERYPSIKDTKRGVLFSQDLQGSREVSSTSVVGSLKRSDAPIFALMIDGTATESLIAACEEFGVAYLGARTFASAAPTKVHLISLY